MQRALTVLVALVVVATCVARSTSLAAWGGFAHLALPQELAAAIGALVLVIVALVARARVASDAVRNVVIAILAFEIACIAGAANPWIALRASSLVVAGAATFLVARSTTTREAPAWLLAPILVVAVSVLLEARGIVVGLSRSGHSPGGVLGERNAAAELLICGLPLAVACSQAKDLRVRVAALLTTLASVAAIVCTRTRSAWLAAAVLAVLGIALALRTANARRNLAPVMVALALGLGLGPRISTLHWASTRPYQETLAHLVDPASTSGHGRLVQYATTLKVAAAHPWLGVGPGNWAGAYATFAKTNDPTVMEGLVSTNRLPSSDVLGFVAERGVLATLLVVALGVLLARRGPHLWLRRATLLGALIVGSLDAVVQLAPHLLLVAAIVGSTMAKPALAPRTRATHVAFALPLALAVFLAVQRLRSFEISVRPVGMEELEVASALDRGDTTLHLRLAEDWLSADRCDRAAPHLRVVHEYAPASPMLRSLERDANDRNCAP